MESERQHFTLLHSEFGCIWNSIRSPLCLGFAMVFCMGRLHTSLIIETHCQSYIIQGSRFKSSVGEASICKAPKESQAWTGYYMQILEPITKTKKASNCLSSYLHFNILYTIIYVPFSTWLHPSVPNLGILASGPQLYLICALPDLTVYVLKILNYLLSPLPNKSAVLCLCLDWNPIFNLNTHSVFLHNSYSFQVLYTL